MTPALRCIQLCDTIASASRVVRLSPLAAPLTSVATTATASGRRAAGFRAVSHEVISEPGVSSGLSCEAGASHQKGGARPGTPALGRGWEAPQDSLSASVATHDAVHLLPRLSEVLRHFGVVLE